MLLYSDQLLMIEALTKQVGALLADKGKKIATAESCTGGWIAEAITQVNGSSLWFDRGFVTYSNEAKREMLGVKLRTLNQHGAVSRKTVEEMAVGALKKSRAQYAVAVSGIAGPGGGSEDKPVGTVWFAWNIEGEVDSSLVCLPGDRRDVRAAAVTLALQGLLVRVRPQLEASERSILSPVESVAPAEVDVVPDPVPAPVPDPDPDPGADAGSQGNSKPATMSPVAHPRLEPALGEQQELPMNAPDMAASQEVPLGVQPVTDLSVAARQSAPVETVEVLSTGSDD